MTNKELIDAYFDGSLGEAEKQSLMDQLSSNSELKQEFELQSDIVQGLKSARKAELKSIMNNVPIGNGGYSSSIFGKVALIGLIAASGTIVYLNFFNNTEESQILAPKELNETIEDLISEEEVIKDAEDETLAVTKEKSEEAKEAIDTQEEKAIEVKKPEIKKPDVVGPLDIVSDDTEDMMPEGIAKENVVTISNIDIEVDNSKRKYSFHYQFKQGKLFLFGSFDKGLYEILEFNSNGNGKVLYLFYKEKYYGLNKRLTNITALSEIKEDSLLENLEKARADIKN